LANPKIVDFYPLWTKCERRLIATSLFLNQAERLQLTNSVITALPTFSMCTFKLQNTQCWIRLINIESIVFREELTQTHISQRRLFGPWFAEIRMKGVYGL
jgi:hypothetical protein